MHIVILPNALFFRGKIAELRQFLSQLAAKSETSAMLGAESGKTDKKT